MKTLLILLSLITFSPSVFAVTAQELSVEFAKILVHCKKIGFYKCQNKFEGTSRGVFHLPIELQKLKLTEEAYNNFIKKRYKQEFHVSLFKLSASLKINTTDNFDILTYLKNIKHIQPMNKESTIHKILFNKAEPVALIKTTNEYKIGVFPEQEKAFRKSKSMNSVQLLRLKTNILRYHMKEAEIMNQDNVTLKKKISEAIAPILVKLAKGKVPDYLNAFIHRDIKEVQRYYMPLNSDAAIMKKIKIENKL